MSSAHLLLSNVRAALLGLATGDALGVPVEFTTRTNRQLDPVTGMRSYGTHGQPAGTWSDDTSLTLCLAESLAQGYTPEDLAMRIRWWYERAYWTATNEVFDVGVATQQAIGRLRAGAPPTQAGGTDEKDNGNGALMRILPLVFHPLWQNPATSPAQRLALTHEVSSITHGHPRSAVACYLYLAVARHLLAGASPHAAYEAVRQAAGAFLPTAGAPYTAELAPFEAFLNGTLPTLTERHVHSSGYVVHTLEAALWCLLTETTYAATVLKAVNLGDDTDTTGAVAGGLAGLVYGEAAIPAEWLGALARRLDIEALTERLTERLAG